MNMRTNHSRLSTPLLAASTLLFAATSASLAGPGYSIPWFTIDGGGGTISGGSYTLSGTIGQPDAGATLTGGSYTLTGGFWTVAQSVPCLADFNNDGNINILDVIGFVTNWNAQGPGADFNMDGNVNILDVIGFIQTWNAGCP